MGSGCRQPELARPRNPRRHCGHRHRGTATANTAGVRAGSVPESSWDRAVALARRWGSTDGRRISTTCNDGSRSVRRFRILPARRLSAPTIARSSVWCEQNSESSTTVRPHGWPFLRRAAQRGNAGIPKWSRTLRASVRATPPSCPAFCGSRIGSQPRTWWRIQASAVGAARGSVGGESKSP